MVQLDSGYSWIICLSSFFGYLFTMMGIGSVGILFPEFLFQFSSSKANTAWIGSINNAIGAFVGIFLVPVLPKVGARPTAIVGCILGTSGYFISSFSNNIFHLCLTFGLLAGIGNGFLFFSSTVILHHYFDRRRTLAVAIATCGIGSSTLVFPPLTGWLVDAFGWRFTLLTLSAIYLHSSIAGVLMLPISQTSVKRQLHKDVDDQRSNHSKAAGVCSLRNCCSSTIFSIWKNLHISILKNPRVFILNIGTFLSLTGYVVPLVFLPIYSQQNIGMSPAWSATMVSIVAGANITGRIFSGIIGDRLTFLNRKGKRVIQYSLPMIFAGLSTTSVYFIRNESCLISYCIIFGFLSGCYIIALQPSIVDLFGLDFFDRIFAISSFCSGMSVLLAQPIAGWLVDISGTLALPFLVFGLIQVFSGILISSLGFQRKQNSKEISNQEVNRPTMTKEDALNLSQMNLS